MVDSRCEAFPGWYPGEGELVPSPSLPSTLEVIQSRIQAGSQPGERADPYNVQLVAQGAGKRGGAIIAGMVKQLRDMGQDFNGYNGLDAFDGFHAASSSSCILAVAATERLDGQLEKIETILEEDLNTADFFSMKRIGNGLVGRGQPAMNVGFLTDDILRNRKPLLWERLADTGRPVYAYVTSALDGRAKGFDLSTLTSQDDVLQTLHASCRYPVFSGPPMLDIDGEPCVDGGVAVVGPPIKQAIEHTEPTHILGLAREPNWVKPRWSPMTSAGALVMGHGFPALAESMRTLRGRYAANMAYIDQLENGQVPNGPVVQTVRIPSGKHKTFSMEMDPEVLHAATDLGMTALRARFAVSPVRVQGDDWSR